MGGIPLQAASIEKALAMNGVAVEANIEAFRWGRLIAAAPERIAGLLPRTKARPKVEPATYEELRADLAARLTAYQNRAYAERFLAALKPLERAEGADTEKPLSTLAARSLFKAMAYKDEYEVARLYSTPAFRARLAAEFPERAGLRLHLAPPFLARRDPLTGHPRKMAFGGWIFPLFTVLARFSLLRGTVFDPFGHTQERHEERAFALEVETLIRRVAEGLHDGNRAAARALLSLPLEVKGYGHVKAANMQRCRHTMERDMDAFLTT